MQRKKYLCCECQESVCSEVLVMKPLMQPPPALNGGPPSHYVAFHSVTSGLNGPDLGSDESDIVLLVFIVAADGAPAVDRDHPKSQVCQYQVTSTGQSWI